MRSGSALVPAASFADVKATSEALRTHTEPSTAVRFQIDGWEEEFFIGVSVGFIGLLGWIDFHRNESTPRMPFVLLEHYKRVRFACLPQ